jgi:hypothetical protein
MTILTTAMLHLRPNPANLLVKLDLVLAKLNSLY